MSVPRITSIGTDKAAVGQAINRAAQRTGIDFTYLYNQARVESGLNPGAQARNSSASGLFQFIDQTWLGTVKQHGADHGLGWAADRIERSGGRWVVRDPAAKAAIFRLRGDADAASLMAAEFARDNAQHLDRALDRPVNATDLYFAHFLGAKGASRFLKAADAAPGAAAASLFPREAGANRAIFYTKAGAPRSLEQVYALMARKIEGARGPAPTAMESPVQYAAATDPGVRLVDIPASTAAQAHGDAGTMLALANRGNPMAMLRPEPASARLAYLMIASNIV